LLMNEKKAITPQAIRKIDPLNNNHLKIMPFIIFNL